MSDEAKTQVEPKFVWEGVTTDLSSFNSYGVVTLSNGQEVNVQMTYRHGFSPTDMYNDFKNYVAFLDMCATDHSVKFWDGSRKGDTPVSNASNGNGSTPAESAPSAGDKPKRNYKDPIPQGELPEELVQVNEPVYAAEFDFFVVKPDLDGKSVVEFWKDDLNFPVGAKMNKWKHDTIKQAMANLTEQAIDPGKAEKYRVAGTQYYVLGNEFTIAQGPKKGEKSHYKNIILLKPTF